MAMFAKLRRMLLSKPKTAGYKSVTHTPFRRIRDLDPFTFEVIEQMLVDPTIRLGLAMRAAPLAQAEFAYKQKDEWVPGIQAARPDVARFVHRQLKRIWQFELHKILTAQIWGWSAGEMTYRLGSTKLVEVDGILHRNAFDVFALREDGEVKGTRFTRLPGGKVDLRFPAAIWHAYNPEAESPYGISALKGAHSPWADKWMDGGALDTRRLFAHKDAYGGVDITYPPETTNIDGVETPNANIARQIAEQLKAGGVTTRPSEYDENGKPLWEITRATIPTSPTHIFDYPKDLDTEILRGLEIPDDVLKSDTGSGAWAGKQVPMLAFYMNADRWLAQVVWVVVTQILEPLVLLNWNRAEDFEVMTKPLAEQAMEQMQKSQAGQEQQGGQQPAAPPNGAGPFINVRGPNGNVLQRRNPRFGRQQLGLDDGNVAELMVGQGVVDAAELVEAGRQFLTNGHRERKRLEPRKAKAKVRVDETGRKRLAISHAAYSVDLTDEETKQLEDLVNG